MLPIQLHLLTNRRTRPALRDDEHYAIRQLKGIIAHWTANTRPGADARANRNYFNHTQVFASAHYIVDDKEIIQCIPDNEVAYHVGARYYKPDGKQMIAGTGLTPNYFTVGFEMCVNSDGNWQTTYQNAARLAAHLLHKYRLTTGDLYRHYDITGKDCPKMMLNEADWRQFKRTIAGYLSVAANLPIARALVTAYELNVRSGPGVGNPVKEVLRRDERVDIFEERANWARIGNRRWVSMNYLSVTSRNKTFFVTHPRGANLRSGPGMEHPIVDACPTGTVLDVLDQSGNWFHTNVGHWVHRSLIEPVNLMRGKVIGTPILNVRSGPSTQFSIARRIRLGDLVDIYEEKSRWYRIGQNLWVFSGYIERL